MAEKFQRELDSRRRELAKALLACPKCGESPEIDFGFADAPYPPGEEFIACPAVLSLGGDMQRCGTFSIGAAHWNFRRGKT